ncbi:hypothetical protein DESC_780093 [Desulfosarcina cetonica]|nr:hypothetical protein DESC_780093 [Desulfosarcina cetonica]
MFALGHDIGAGAGFMGKGKGGADFDDGILGLAIVIGTTVKDAVHGEDIGAHAQQQGVGLFGLDVDGVVVHDGGAFKKFEQPLEVDTLFQSLQGEFNVFGGKRVAAVELDPLTQIKAHGQIVDALPAGGQARLDGHVLGVADQGIEHPVGILQHAAGELDVRVQGYRVGIQAQFQSGGPRGCAKTQYNGKAKGDDE